MTILNAIEKLANYKVNEEECVELFGEPKTVMQPSAALAMSLGLTVVGGDTVEQATGQLLHTFMMQVDKVEASESFEGTEHNPTAQLIRETTFSSTGDSLSEAIDLFGEPEENTPSRLVIQGFLDYAKEEGLTDLQVLGVLFMVVTGLSEKFLEKRNAVATSETIH